MRGMCSFITFLSARMVYVVLGGRILVWSMVIFSIFAQGMCSHCYIFSRGSMYAD